MNYFLVVLGGKTIGYFAWKMENTALHLMHLYLKPEYRGKALGRDIVLSCERLARGEGKGRVWCTVHAKALPVQQFFKALRYRNLKPAEQDTGTVPGTKWCLSILWAEENRKMLLNFFLRLFYTSVV